MRRKFNLKINKPIHHYCSISGFTLIEILVVIFITSFFAPVLLTSLYQFGQFQTRIDNLITIHMRIGITAHQLEKDIMGAFIPMQAQKEKKENKEHKPLEQIFFSVHKDGKLQTLSFISNNPTQVYVGEKVGTIKPRIVRVHYTMQPEEGQPNSFVLMRQESTELEIEKYKDYKKIHAYELLSGIKSLSCTFTACIEKKKETKKQNEKEEEEQKPIYEYQTVSEWSSETKGTQSTTKTEKETPWPRIPCHVTIKLALWDKQYTKEQTYTLGVDILTDDAIAKPEQPQEEKQPPIENDKTEMDNES